MNRTVIKATETLAAIDRAIEADQGASYRLMMQKVLPHIGDAYRGVEKNPFRNHMGASGIGKECGRAIWYDFHWVTTPKFPGRILRLFNTGHMAEAKFISMLSIIGVQVYQQDENGKQFRIHDAGGHFGGSGDGVGIGLPDLPPGTPALLEFKTHNDASFKKLVKEGVRATKFEHYVQMQVYMRKMQLMVGLYGAVNKNDDALHLEIIHLDTATADQFIDRGRQLVFMREVPKRINNSPGWFGCAWCDHKPVCHLKATPSRNCRSCVHATTREDGHWYCTEPTADQAFGDNPQLTEDDQLAACDAYTALTP